MNQEKIETVKIPLKGSGQRAELHKQDFDALMALGVSPNWLSTDTTNNQVKTSHRGKYISIARLIMDAGKSQAVKYLDGDRTNLKRENLTIIPGAAKSRDRDHYLAPT